MARWDGSYWSCTALRQETNKYQSWLYARWALDVILPLSLAGYSHCANKSMKTFPETLLLKLFMALYTKCCKTHNLFKVDDAEWEIVVPRKQLADESSTGVNNQHNYREKQLSWTNC